MTVLTSFHLREIGGPQGVETAVSDLSEADRTRLELQAMQAIAEALVSLPDERMRGRVMAWAGSVIPGCQTNGHGQSPAFGLSSPAPQRTAAPGIPLDEPALSIEGVEALFDDGRPSPGQFPPSAWELRQGRRLSPRVILRFRWWR